MYREKCEVVPSFSQLNRKASGMCQRLVSSPCTGSSFPPLYHRVIYVAQILVPLLILNSIPWYINTNNSQWNESGGEYTAPLVTTLHSKHFTDYINTLSWDACCKILLQFSQLTLQRLVLSSIGLCMEWPFNPLQLIPCNQRNLCLKKFLRLQTVWKVVR